MYNDIFLLLFWKMSFIHIYDLLKENIYMKSKILICCIAFIMTATSCTNGHTKAKHSTTNDIEKKSYVSDNADQELSNVINQLTRLYDKDGNVIGQIERYGFISIAGEKLLYPNLAQNSTYENTIQDFYLYDMETKENTKLGRIEDVIYEASYDRVMLDDHIYTIFTTGDLNDSESWEYNLVDFDLENKSMDIILSEKDDYLYSIMDSIDDDLLIVRHDDGISGIEKYDTESKTFTELKKFRYDYNNETGETIYQIYYDESQDYIYTLRCKFNGSDPTNLFVDKYDNNMKLISKTDISDVFSVYDEETNEMEKCQPVFGFFCKNDYIYYESRSISRIVGKLDENGVTSLVDDNPEDYSAALSVIKNSSEQVFYKPFDEGCPLFVLNTKSGEMKETSFKVKEDDRYCILDAYQYADKLLIEMTDIEANAPDEREPRIYIVDTDELE